MSDSVGRLITFFVAGKRHALRLEQAAEVLEEIPTFPVPGVPPWLGEAINCHGRIVPVLDLAVFLGAPVLTRGGTVVVLDRRAGDLALRVEGAVAIVAMDAAMEELGEAESPVERYLVVAGQRLALLSPEAVVEALEEILKAETWRMHG